MTWTTAIDPGEHAGWAMFSDRDLVACGPGTPDVFVGEVVIECPFIYPRGEADPNDLIILARRVGRLEERAGKPCVLVFPRTWKGTIKKAIMTARIRKKLTDTERTLLTKDDHNVIDAIGLGLWRVGRLGK